MKAFDVAGARGAMALLGESCPRNPVAVRIRTCRDIVLAEPTNTTGQVYASMESCEQGEIYFTSLRDAKVSETQ